MTDEAIAEKVRKMIVERVMLKIQPHEIGLEDDLMKTFLDGDSVRLMEVVIGLEEAFEISVADEDFGKGNFLTVKAITAFVKKRLPG